MASALTAALAAQVGQLGETGHVAARAPGAAGPVLPGPGDLAFSVNPISWLGDGAAAAAGDVFKTAMTGLWSAGLWVLGLAFQVIDAFTTPDVSGNGPIGSVLPTTAGIGATVAVLMMSVQLATAMVRRDGQSLGRVVIGLGQFAMVWAGYLVVATVFVTAASGLEHTILRQMLHVDTLSSYDLLKSWPRKVSDLTVATVLGLSAVLLVIPAAFAYVLLMLVREAALLILVATSPITAAGLLADSTKAWFWKSLRWFISSLLIAPTSALMLGIGVQVSNGVIAGRGDKTAAAVGTAVIGALIIAIGATSPLVLFRLLAFVEPGTASGAALRQSWSDAGGISGVMSGAAGGKGSSSGGHQGTGSAAASSSGSDGRSGGESAAEAQTQSRMAGMFGGGAPGKVAAGIGGGAGKASGGFGAVTRAAGPLVSAAQRAVDIGSDVLGQAGVGAPGYSQTPTDERSKRRGQGGRAGQGIQGGQGRTQQPASAGGNGGGAAGGGAGPASAPSQEAAQSTTEAQSTTDAQSTTGAQGAGLAGVGQVPDDAAGGPADGPTGGQPEIPGLGAGGRPSPGDGGPRPGGSAASAGAGATSRAGGAGAAVVPV